MALAGLSGATRSRILAARSRRPFRSVEDFLERAAPDAAEVRSLVRSGALDGLAPGEDRATLMWRLARRRTGGLREGLLFERTAEQVRPAFPPEDPLERLRREFAVLGFLCDRHPMALYAGHPFLRGAVPSDRLHGRVGRRVRFAGWLITGKVVHTRAGEPMEFVTFEDERGVVEATFFPEVYRRFCHLIDRGRPYLLEGRVEDDRGALTLTVDRAALLPPPAPSSGAPG
jgi:DNA polymerase-3 subunit alpha/error-prone DNA polymerase